MEIRLHPPIAKVDEPETRDLPYVIRGRDVEMALIGRRLHRLPVTSSLIVGAPGTGKTSMLAGLRMYALSHGIRVVDLDVGALTDAKEIRATLAQRAESSTPVLASVVYTGTKPAGVDAKVIHGDRATETQATYVMPEHAVAALRDAAWGNHPNGLLITIDEIQNLQRLQGEQREHVRRVLEFLHDGMSGDTHQRAPGMVVYAGLLDSHQVLREYGLSRIEEEKLIRLPPLTLQAGHTILRDYLEVEDESGNRPIDVDAEIIEALAERYHRNAHHINTAGFYLQEEALSVAGVGGNSRLPRQALGRIVARVEERKSNLYANRCEEMDAAEQDGAFAMAQAARDRDNRLDALRAERMLFSIAERHGQPGEQLRRKLLHRGITMVRNPNHYYPTLDKQGDERYYWEIAIDSMATWLDDQRKQLAGDSSDELFEQLDFQDLIDRFLTPKGHKITVPAWRWLDAKPKRELIPWPETAPTVRYPEDILAEAKALLQAPEPPSPANESVKDVVRAATKIGQIASVAMPWNEPSTPEVAGRTEPTISPPTTEEDKTNGV